MKSDSLSREAFVWALGSLCQLHHRSWDAGLLLREYPASPTLAGMLEAAGRLGLEVRKTDLASNRTADMRLPALVFRKCGDPLIVVRMGAERVLYFRNGSQEPCSESLGPFLGEILPEAFEVGVAAPPDTREDAVPDARERDIGVVWFLREMGHHRAVWRDVLLASLAIQVLGLGLPLFTQVIIDKVVVHQTRSTLLAVAFGMALFMAFGVLLGWLRQYLVLHTGNRIDAVLCSRVFSHLLRLPLPYFERRPSGTLVARLQAVETIRAFITGVGVAALLDIPFLVILLIAMYWYSAQLCMVAVLCILLMAGISAGVTPTLRARLDRQFLLGARNQAFVTEHVAGIETVKSLQMEPSLLFRYEGMVAQWLQAGFSTRMLSGTANSAVSAVEQAMTLAILCLGALMVMENAGFTIGMLVAVQMFAGRLSQPVMRLSGLWQEFQQASMALRRIGDVLGTEPEVHTLNPAVPMSKGPATLEVQGLGFRYGPERPWLFRQIDLELRAGQLMALTGPSGSGKSTLAKLALGFYPPTEGRILLDCRNVRNLAMNELRAAFGVVPQETLLFSGSVTDNVLAGYPLAGREEAVRACRAAGLHESIMALPQGYHTLLGEHGIGLSGGQKQRLAIARALVRNPRILVFDESTSSLDPETAGHIAATVNGLRGQVSILFIAHHLPATLAIDARVMLDTKEIG